MVVRDWCDSTLQQRAGLFRFILHSLRIVAFLLFQIIGRAIINDAQIANANKGERRDEEYLATVDENKMIIGTLINLYKIKRCQKSRTL